MKSQLKMCNLLGVRTFFKRGRSEPRLFLHWKKSRETERYSRFDGCLHLREKRDGGCLIANKREKEKDFLGGNYFIEIFINKIKSNPQFEVAVYLRGTLIFPNPRKMIALTLRGGKRQGRCKSGNPRRIGRAVSSFS